LTDVSQAEPFRAALAQIRRRQRARVPLRVQHEGKHVEYRLNVQPTPTLLIAGAGHVGLALAKLAMGLDFRVVLLDDRSHLLGPQRVPAGIETVAGNVETLLQQWPIAKSGQLLQILRAIDVHQHAAIVDLDKAAVHPVGSQEIPERFVRPRGQDGWNHSRGQQRRMAATSLADRDRDVGRTDRCRQRRVR